MTDTSQSENACGTACPGQEGASVPSDAALRDRMAQIRHKILVFSGKGGVGKSTVAANLAASLAARGNRVGLLDIDFHGPSIPHLLGISGQRPASRGSTITPLEARPNLFVMSLGLLLENADDAVIWRGPMKMGVIQQLLRDVEWGACDYLILDSPPGTGDEPLSVCQSVPDPDGAVLVTTPQELAVNDVRKSVAFCRKLALPVLGIIENMSGFVCPACGETMAVLKADGGRKLAEDMRVPFLGSIPMDMQVMNASDSGRLFATELPGSHAAEAFSASVDALLPACDDAREPARPSTTARKLRIAIPLAEGKLSPHFGHCDTFALVDSDPETGSVLSIETRTPPPHEPGVLPRWLAEHDARCIIAGGMGQRAQQLFRDQGIDVITGAPRDTPEALVANYLRGTLTTGENLCDH